MSGTAGKGKEVERQLDEALKRWARYMARSLVIRIILACAVAVALLIPCALLVWALAARSQDDSAAAVILAVVGTGAIFCAVIVAIWPQKAISWAIRSSNTFPTRMPGYRTPLSGESDQEERRDGA